MADPSAPIIPPSRPVSAGRLIGDYQIEGELGRGGMGIVYRARQVTLNRIVALKMLTGHYGPDELTRFLGEAETAAGLHHTNIVQIYEVGETEGAPFYAMEYIESGSLGDRLRSGPIEEREAAQLLISVARALHFAHRNGVIHRDMKPANVLLDPEGVPKLADFGIAKKLTANSSLTLSGAVIGTPTYMAPEQAKGTSRDVGAAADVYSLGAILYEMLSGRPPFLPDDSETALTVRVITEDAVSPAFFRPGVSRDLETICMKCLEKEPGDRYESAAAFAEDLRRYLEDESILARPPTTAVRTIKWIRRHPWRFVSRTALVAGVVAAALWLLNWELYQRPRLEYARGVEFRNGVLDSTGSITKDETSRLTAHYRLTRRGRLGRVTRLEVLNPRGHPAQIRRLVLGDAVPIYIEGISGAQPYDEKAIESSALEFIYDDEGVRELLARDRNEVALWRVLYDRPTASEAAERIRRGHFVSVRGFNVSHSSAATHMRFERDTAGRDLKVLFFNSAGQPAVNGERVFGYRLDRDQAGRLARLTHLDGEGRPMPNRNGVIAYGYTCDGKGRVVRMDTYDAEGKLVALNGIASATTEYDKAGNAVRVNLLGTDGKLARFEDNWAVQELGYDQFGQVIARKYFRSDSEGKLIVAWEWTAIYDDFGYPRQIKISGTKPSCVLLRHDERGNSIEDTNADEAGRPIVNEKGYATRKCSYKFNSDGRYWEEAYFDAAGAKTYCTAGYHRLTSLFDANGALRRQTTEELDPSRFHYFRDVSLPEWDTLGRVRRNVFRHENEKGELALDAGLPNAQSEDSYDENGRVYLSWEIGCAAWRGAPSFSYDLEWHKTGAWKRRVIQACDANRKPLAVTSTGIPARVEEEYDQINQFERILESGFNETTHGYSTRETKFSGGTVQSVTRKRGDGTLVEAVRVLIVAVQATQPKVAELKEGDELVESNGVPVRSAYEWAATPFPGGWLEVIRDGKRVRIEGLDKGPLGIGLEERAALNP
jgi:serine/threonine protein kinase